MKIIKIKMSELVTPEKNIRIHTEKQINEFIRSIKMFGQIRPIVVDEKNTILAGNGLYIALKKLDYIEADVYKLSDLTENQKKKLMIADNKIFNLGIENLDVLNDFLNELNTDLDIPGFDESILKTMVADAETVTQKIVEYGTLNEDEISQIKENGKRKEILIQKAEETAEHEDIESIENDNDTEKLEPAYAICPKCGETIWL